MRVYPNPEKTVNGILLKVRDPDRGDYLPAEGREVASSTWWLRRIKCGDVLEGRPVGKSLESRGDNAVKMPQSAAPDTTDKKPRHARSKKTEQ